MAKTAMPPGAARAAAAEATSDKIQSTLDVSNLSDDDFAAEFDLASLTGGEGGEETPAPEGEASTAEDTREQAPSTPAEGEEGDEEEPAPAEGETPDEGTEEEGEETPEGEQPGAPEKPAKAPAFTAWDPTDGQELEVPNFEIEFTADGKKRRAPLDKVVQYAQWGFYNERLQGEVQQAREMLPKAQEYIEHVETELRETHTLAERLLTDPEYFKRAKAEYDQINSPAARADRAERRLAERDAQDKGRAQSQQTVRFLAEGVAPVYEGFLKQYSTVPPEEAWGKFVLLTQPMMVNGVLPQNRLRDVAHAVRDELGPWMAQQHEKRTAKERKATEERDTEVRRANERTTQTKRQIGRMLKPQGRSGGVREAPARKPIATADDAMEDVIAGAFPGT